jgi:hypothetical protein
MKNAFLKRCVLTGLAMGLTAISALAGDQKKDVIIPRDCVVQGQEVKAGNYTLEFSDDRSGEAVLMKGKKEVVRTPYKIVDLSKQAGSDVVVFSNKNGTRSISRIEMKGMKVALQLD